MLRSALASSSSSLVRRAAQPTAVVSIPRPSIRQASRTLPRSDQVDDGQHFAFPSASERASVPKRRQNKPNRRPETVSSSEDSSTPHPLKADHVDCGQPSFPPASKQAALPRKKSSKRSGKDDIVSSSASSTLSSSQTKSTSASSPALLPLKKFRHRLKNGSKSDAVDLARQALQRDEMSLLDFVRILELLSRHLAPVPTDAEVAFRDVDQALASRLNIRDTTKQKAERLCDLRVVEHLRPGFSHGLSTSGLVLSHRASMAFGPCYADLHLEDHRRRLFDLFWQVRHRSSAMSPVPTSRNDVLAAIDPSVHYASHDPICALFLLYFYGICPAPTPETADRTRLSQQALVDSLKSDDRDWSKVGASILLEKVAFTANLLAEKELAPFLKDGLAERFETLFKATVPKKAKKEWTQTLP